MSASRGEGNDEKKNLPSFLLSMSNIYCYRIDWPADKRLLYELRRKSGREISCEGVVPVRARA